MKKAPKVHENIERWMVSYADFMTLMFAVFVVLYSFAMTKQSEAQSMVQGLVQSFNEMGMVSSTPGIIALPGPVAQSQIDNALAAAQARDNQVTAEAEGGGGLMDFGLSSSENSTDQSVESAQIEGNLTVSELDNPSQGRQVRDYNTRQLPTPAGSEGGVSPGGQPDEIDDGGTAPADTNQLGEAVTGEPFDAIMRSLSSTLEDMGVTGSVDIEQDARFLTINIGSALLFAEDSAAVLNTARPVIAQIARVLSSINNYVRVRGYTDNSFNYESVYKNNWELSAARAIAVLDELQEFGVDAERLAVEAYGQYAPFYSNTTRAGRAQNRRVVIAVSRYAMDKKEPQILQGDGQSHTETAVGAGSGGIRFDRNADGSVSFSIQPIPSASESEAPGN